MYVYKDYNYYIIFKPYFKPILHSNLLSNIAGIGTVIFKINIIVKTQYIKLYNIVYILNFYFYFISALKFK